MNPYRPFMTTGVALIAAAVLISTGSHGFWWLFGLAWAFGLFGGGHRTRRRYACGVARHRDAHEVPRDAPVEAPTEAPRETVPDPTRDQHHAFPPAR